MCVLIRIRIHFLVSLSFEIFVIDIYQIFKGNVILRKLAFCPGITIKKWLFVFLGDLVVLPAKEEICSDLDRCECISSLVSGQLPYDFVVVVFASWHLWEFKYIHTYIYTHNFSFCLIWKITVKQFLGSCKEVAECKEYRDWGCKVLVDISAGLFLANRLHCSVIWKVRQVCLRLISSTLEELSYDCITDELTMVYFFYK